MKPTLLLTLLVALLPLAAHAQVTDSVDVLDYDATIDLSQGKPFAGDVTITLRLTAPCASIDFSLRGTADSLWVDGSPLTPTLQGVSMAGHTPGDTVTVRYAYTGNGYVEPTGWGGFHFDKTKTYNLGVGFSTNPHSMGSVLMPCRDNFHDKATYTLRIRTHAGWTAECSGTLLQRQVADDQTEHSVWRVDQPASIYLIGIGEADWKRQHDTITTPLGSYPLTLAYTNGSDAYVKKAFELLTPVVTQYEQYFGPYRWHRIGYIATPRGSMEHVNNIALDATFMTSKSERAQMTIAHELGHAWFGNLVTCATEADMWFNEGGASFCSEVAMEATKGPDAARRYYQTNLESVLRTTHFSDGTYLALSPMPHNRTYGSTTYDKGALVWHSLRGLLSDALFFPAIQQLMADKAFSTVTAAELRDSLNTYTGYDMTDFFDFHVFQPGFADYHLELAHPSQKAAPSVRIRTQGVGTDSIPRSSWLPFCLYDAEGSTIYTVLPISSADTVVSIPMGLDAAYCVLDPACVLSDAATLATFTSNGNTSANEAHFQLGGKPADGETIYVEHHWGQPWDTDTLTGVVRTARRYWMVRGAEWRYEGLQGQLHFVCEQNSASDYPHLDWNFYHNRTSIDSIAVLFRPDSRHPWQAITRQYKGTADEGYFLIDNLRRGEYTLAVVDTNLIAIARPRAAAHSANLFPNPVKQGAPLAIDIPSPEPFRIVVTDLQGHTVWQHDALLSRQPVTLPLPAGTYTVRIENPNTTIQSKLIVI